MPDTSSSQSPTPAVLRFRGLDLEAMTALQMRNIDAVRCMANLMLDSTQEITERQAAFLKAGADQMNATFERGEGASDPKAIFERQTEAYRDLFGAFVTHVGELGEITSKCCAGLAHEATGKMNDRPTRESRTEQPAKRAGCCCGPSKDAAENEVELPTAENRTEPTAKRAGAASKTSSAKK